MEDVTLLYTVDDLNTDLAEHLIPNNVILSLYIFLGIFGNILVILVYRFRLKGMSDERFFIPVLAAADLIASTACASFAIILNLLQVKFTNGGICKLMWFFASSSTYLSILLLEIIAIHRYIKVCHSSGKQMTLFWKRISIACAFFLAVIIGLPTTFLYGSVDFHNSEKHIVGRRCSKLHDGPKIVSLVYTIVLGLLMLVIITSLFVFYGKIGWKIYHHLKYMKQLRNKHSPKSEESVPTNESRTNDSTDSNTHQSVDINRSSDVAPGGEPNSSGKQFNNVKSNRCMSEKGKRDRKIMNRLTFMFMIITIVFLVSFVPKIVLVLLEGRNKRFWESFSDSNRAAVLFVYRSYTINNIINPFIYAFMDVKFRNELKTMCSCSKRK